MHRGACVPSGIGLKIPAMRALKILGAIVAGAVVWIVIIGAVAGSGDDRQECDGREERDRWINTRRGEFRGRSPRQAGLRALGSCSEKILDTRLDCDGDSVVSDSPYLRRALEMGFTTYVCERMGSSERVEFTLGNIVR